jgi:YbgC/YbaW family acyl-CoA thioester hydrolase
MAEAFRCTRQVEFNDTDMAGIAHFTAFFRWMEEAETTFLRSRGMTVLGDWQGQKVSLPRVAVSCDFARAVSFGDEMTIVVTVEKIGRTSLTYAFDFFKGEEAVARGHITAVFCQTTPDGGLKAREIPPMMRELLQ